VLGFASLDGYRGATTQPAYKLKKPRKESLEYWIDPRLEYAFVDFQPFNRQHPDDRTSYYLRGGVLFAHGRASCHKAQWNRVYDGVFYIKTMYPCKIKAYDEEKSD
jgi:erythromycin esterase